jgi:hypothetical protein
MFPLSKTLKQLRAFWRVMGYGRIWILGYADLARPLYRIFRKVQKEPQPFIELDGKSESAFHQLKKASMIAPTLGLQVKNKFQLYVSEMRGLSLGVVTQLWGITPQPVGYIIKNYIRCPRDGQAVFGLSLKLAF